MINIEFCKNDKVITLNQLNSLSICFKTELIGTALIKLVNLIRAIHIK